MKKRVLITGSNGVLGKNLVKYLHNSDADTYQLVLFDLNHSDDFTREFETYQGDIRNPDDVKFAMRDIEIVVHCAAASPSYPAETVFDIIINGTANLLNCAFTATGRVERFIYISSTSVYGIPQKAPIDETEPTMPYDPYNKSKIAAEALCCQWREQGKCISILRPRTFIGPERLGTFGILFEWASEGHNFPMLGKGQNKYQLLDVEDLCQAIYLAMTGKPELVNDLFNIGAGSFSTLKEDYQSVLDVAGFCKKIISLPASPMFFLLNILELLKLSPFYKRLYRKLNRDYYVSIEKASTKLGYQPRYSNKEALVKNYYWYLNHKAALHGQTGNGNNITWNQGILRLAKLFF
ncbi:MAG TPA: NAD(P)-dependent oxidoreductase [Bacillota bacterium]|nr:NAD(P)-dependent oxidoreductase [Bacillota bacterium]